MPIVERTSPRCGQTGGSLEYLVDSIQEAQVCDIVRLLIIKKRAYVHFKCRFTRISQ